ncbi:hypothetical protein OWR29_02140 [Actinoplanes sp. Pm04-4]|uniref:Mycothiol-dependent maleylpyruvate isomerase metal-binding domain-containing protein n=1 Tax=Paractinoplanes pyxinae TaxID=2997416 RepID=A0ABT4ARB6_9ACTN|nr:hypothetical protein [Actinoplanes pyxinae]MCY1136781.1 hypothetical protein [Actinoplanes pyxinae]
METTSAKASTAQPDVTRTAGAQSDDARISNAQVDNARTTNAQNDGARTENEQLDERQRANAQSDIAQSAGERLISAEITRPVAAQPVDARTAETRSDSARLGDGRLDEARPGDAYRVQVAELDRLLGDLPAELWQRPSRPHTSVRAMIVHLSENDALVAGAADVGPRRSNPDVRVQWRSQADAILEAADRDDGALLDRRVRLAGRAEVHRPVRQALIQRGFETWIHAEDVRAVLGLPPRPPAGGQTAGIVGFALSLLPAALKAAGHNHTVRLALTGGGTHLVGPDEPVASSALTGVGTHLIGPDEPVASSALAGVDTYLVGPDEPVASSALTGVSANLVGLHEPVAEITLPAERFCRLVAGRLTPADSGAVISGDREAATKLLSVAATLGCD